MLSCFHLLGSVSEFLAGYLSLLPPFLGILFVSEFGQDLLVHSCMPPGTVVSDFCFVGMHDSWTWRRWSLNISQLFWVPLPSWALSHRTLLHKSLKMTKTKVVICALLAVWRTLFTLSAPLLSLLCLTAFSLRSLFPSSHFFTSLISFSKSTFLTPFFLFLLCPLCFFLFLSFSFLILLPSYCFSFCWWLLNFSLSKPLLC